MLKDLKFYEVLGAFVISASRKKIGVVIDVDDEGMSTILWDDDSQSYWWYWLLKLSVIDWYSTYEI